MSEFIRVRQIETGHELSVPKSHADAGDGYEVLDKPAVDSAGGPLPPKYRTTVDEAAEQSPRRGRRTQTPAAPAADSQPPITDGHQADTPKENA
jgi:hypothetical protein